LIILCCSLTDIFNQHTHFKTPVLLGSRQAGSIWVVGRQEAGRKHLGSKQTMQILNTTFTFAVRAYVIAKGVRLTPCAVSSDGTDEGTKSPFQLLVQAAAVVPTVRKACKRSV